jgi:trk system potassium uptake protein TrkH
VRAYWGHPARLVTLAFATAVVVGTALLLLPVSRTPGSPADLMVASFTTVSAVCVTGLVTVDTATYWTPFGQGVILALIHIGGVGVMALATLLTLAVRGRLGLRRTLVAQAETHTGALGDVRGVLLRVVVIMLLIESVIAAVLTVRFRTTYVDTWAGALWHGVFHAGSSFNNAGFALWTDNLIPFVSDPWVILPICAAVVLGGIGFPVLRELRRRWRTPALWSLHTKITVLGTVLLLVIGTVTFWAFEAFGSGTLAGLDLGGQAIGSVAGGVFPRTAGFNVVDYGQVRDETEAVTTVLMFIGGGSAGTAGGIKVTTFFILGFVILAEVRGEPDVSIGDRRIGSAVQRQALTVALLAVGLVAASIVMVMMVTDLEAIDVSFEVVSAFATVGLSTGITAELPPTAQVILMVLMFIGRVGSITVASALALNTRHRHYRLPEERPIVG